jgi:Holliday junction resolvasome RuvABC endonuclease subunit
MRLRGKTPSVVLGVAPGLTSASFAVLAFSANNAPQVLDYDVLIGTRPSQLAKLGIPALELLSNITELAKRFKVHRLVIEVIVERHTPCLIALAPAARSKEPSAHVAGARMAVRSMAALFDLPVFDVTKEKINRVFQGEKLLTAVQRRLYVPIGSSDRRVMLAAGAALVAATIASPRYSLPLHSVA